MSAFKIGDRVRRDIGNYADTQEGHEYIVRGYTSTGDWAGGDLWLEGHSRSYAATAFTVVEPAEVEQATAILDAADEPLPEDDWWDLELAEQGSILNPQQPILIKDVRKWAGRLGLEVRVQVRRKS